MQTDARNTKINNPFLFFILKEKDFVFSFFATIRSFRDAQHDGQTMWIEKFILSYFIFPSVLILFNFATTISFVRGGAGKSLARPTSRCRTESMVLLERGVCSCAELQVFSCYRGWKEACQATHAISTTSRRQLSSSNPPARQGAERNTWHSERNIRGTCTIVRHRQKMGGPV